MTTLDPNNYINSLGLSLNGGNPANDALDLSLFFVDPLPVSAPLDTVLVWTQDYQLYRFNVQGQWVKLLPINHWEQNGEIVQVGSAPDGLASAQHLMTTNDNASGVPTMAIQPRLLGDTTIGFGMAKVNGVNTSARTGTVFQCGVESSLFTIKVGAGTAGSPVTMLTALAVNSAGKTTLLQMESTGDARFAARLLPITSSGTQDIGAIGGRFGIVYAAGFNSSGNVAIGGTLSVTGLSSLGTTTVTGNLSTSGNLSASGTTTLAVTNTGDLTVAGDCYVTGTLDAGNIVLPPGGTSTVGTLVVAGAASIAGALAVTGAGSLFDSLGITNGLSVGGDLVSGLIKGSGLSTNGWDIGDIASPTEAVFKNSGAGPVTNHYAMKQLATGQTLLNTSTGTSLQFLVNDVVGASLSSSVFAVVPAVTMAATLAVAGITTLAATNTGNLAVTGNATISGTLSAGVLSPASVAVTGNATVGGTLAVTGATTLDSVTVTNGASVGGTLTVPTIQRAGATNGWTVGDSAAVTDAVFTNSAAGTVASNFAIRQLATGETRVNAPTGTTIRLMVNNSTRAQISTNTFAITPNTTIGGTLAVTGTTTAAAINASGNLTVTGTTAFVGSNNTAGNSRLGLGGNGQLDFSYGIFGGTSFPAAASARILATDAGNFSSNLTFLSRQTGSDNGTMLTNMTIDTAGNVAITRGNLAVAGTVVSSGGSMSSVGTLLVGSTLTPLLSRTIMSSNGILDFTYGQIPSSGSTTAPNAASARIAAVDASNFSSDLQFQCRQPGSDNGTMLTNMVIDTAGNVDVSRGNLDVAGNVTCANDITATGIATANALITTAGGAALAGSLTAGGNVSGLNGTFTETLKSGQQVVAPFSTATSGSSCLLGLGVRTRTSNSGGTDFYEIYLNNNPANTDNWSGFLMVYATTKYSSAVGNPESGGTILASCYKTVGNNLVVTTINVAQTGFAVFAVVAAQDSGGTWVARVACTSNSGNSIVSWSWFGFG